MKIVNLKAENIKRLVAVDITPDGNVVEITGANEAGKSSILDSIYWALAGQKSHQSSPIRLGEDSATIELDLGKVVVRREFKLRKGKEEGEDDRITTSIVVESSDGARYPSPQRMLDSLVGAISFDPMSFTRMDSREQYQLIKELTGVDTEPLEKANKIDYENRTDVNRNAKNYRVAATQIGIPDDTPNEEVSILLLVNRLEEADNHNRGIEREESVRSARRRDFDRTREEEQNLRLQIQTLEAQRRDKEDSISRIEADIKSEESLPDPIDGAKIREEMAVAEEVNQHVRRRKERDSLIAKAESEEARSAELTTVMKGRSAEIEKMIAGADMPVEDMTLKNGRVMFKVDIGELPFEVLSDGKQKHISCAIAMRANSPLRVIRVRNGNDLDETSMDILRKTAKAEDYQVWIERVDTTGKVGIVIEDGRVKQQNPRRKPKSDGVG